MVRHVPLQPRTLAKHTMGMPAVDERRWTVAEVHALPDQPGMRVECVGGALLVTPAPSRRHQVAQALLVAFLTEYVSRGRRGFVFVAPTEYVLDTHTAVQPDVSVVPTPAGRAPREDEAGEPPVLFSEIVSPGTARYDRGLKRDRYLRAGVEYWIVDMDARVIERWLPGRSEAELLTRQLTWRLPGHPEECVLDVVDFFARTWGEA